MLKTRVIPTLLWKGFGLVKGVGFDSWRGVGSVQPAIQVYTMREVDELILLNLSSSQEDASYDLDELSEYAALCRVPLTVGGGVSSIDQVQALLKAGADKVSINSAAYGNLDLVREASHRFGVQCIVGSIDAKRTARGWSCYAKCGQVDQTIDPVSWAKQLVDAGVGEILLTSIDRDGTLSGYDLSLIEAVTNAVSVPVIASGGAGSYEHLVEAVLSAGANAVAAASMFHFTEQTPKNAKLYMAEKGIPVRL
jgi:cyclase